MKRFRISIRVFVVLLACVMSSEAQTATPQPTSTDAVPHLVNLGGTLRDLNGIRLTGIIGLTFALYKEDQGGAPLWLETQSVRLDSSGRYSVVLGSTKRDGVPADIFASGEARWLGVQPEGQPEQSRILLVSVPYALKAGDAQTIGGLPPSAFMLATQTSPSGNPARPSFPPPATVTGSGTTNYLPLWTSSSAIGNSFLYQSGKGSAAKLAINGTAPATTLDVNGDSTIRGNETVTGNVSSSGYVNAATSFDLGGIAFALGSYSNANAFLGFSGNSTTTGTFNTASGEMALSRNTSGSFNTAFGALALAFNSSATGNTAQGYEALYANTTGYSNTATGLGTLQNNTTGNSNTATGTLSLPANTTGYSNTGTGSGALNSNTAGTSNTATGVFSVSSNTIGNNNTGIGASALQSNTTGGNNTALGFTADVGSGNLINATAIGYAALVTASNSLVLGSVNGLNKANSNTNVGIGTTAPKAALDVAGNTLETFIGDPACGSGTAAIAFGIAGFQPCSNYALRGDSGGNLYINSSSTGWMFFDHNNSGLVSIDPSGNMSVKGNLSKGGGSFKIDHPLDPANKYLYHSFVESPDMMNIYNGLVTLDARGSAWVTMPDYFEALNQNFRYQLTAIAKPQPNLHIGKELSGNRFKIAGGRAGGRVSWQVTGIRHDAYANAHRIKVEEDKPPQEQGHYLHPELFEDPASDGLIAMRNQRSSTQVDKPRKP